MRFFTFKNKKRSYKSGFTLLELMVATTVFSMIMITAMSALLNVIDANNKARAIKTAINNISFALEGISKDLRMGDKYKCLNSGGTTIGCDSSGNIGISFKSSKAENLYAYYKYTKNDDEIGILESCFSDNSGFCNNYTPLTSEEVNLTDVKFYVYNDTQDRVIITISGEAGSKAKTKTQFDLQTGISKRIR